MRSPKFICVMILCSVIVRTTVAGAAMLEDAQAAYNRQDYTTAFELWKILAGQGDAEAEFNLGMMYDYGFGVKKDSAQAVELFRRSAVQGNVKAERHYEADNFAYHLGLPKIAKAKASDKVAVAVSDVPPPLPVPEKAPEAVVQKLVEVEPAAGTPVPPVRLAPDVAAETNDTRKLSDLANKGDATAQLKMGNFYALGGGGVAQDYQLAADWYAKAADQGNADAEELLGDFYNMGAGVPQSYTKAAELYRQSAGQGNAQAQTELARLYVTGHGVTQDEGQAAVWYTKAAAQNNAEAAYELGNLYAGGIGVKQDYHQAKQYYLQAVKQGNTKAAAALDNIAAEGLDKPQENVSPQHDLQKAAPQAEAAPKIDEATLEKQREVLATKQGFDIGLEASQYHYREKVPGADPFMEDWGKKLGVDVGYTYVVSPSDAFIRGEGRVAHGKVDYTASNGLQITNIPEMTWEARVLAGTDFILDGIDTSPYIGFGYRHFWDNNGEGSNRGPGGYVRDINYRYIPIGFTNRFAVGSQSRIATNIEYDMFTGGSVFSGIGAGLLNTQHRGLGTRGSLMLDLNGLGVSVGPWFNYWNIRQSSANCAGGGFCGLEPDNVTHEYGFKIVKDFW